MKDLIKRNSGNFVFLVLSAGVFLITSGQISSKSNDVAEARRFPYMMCGLIAAMSLLSILIDIYKWRKKELEPQTAEDGRKAYAWIKTIIAAALIIFWFTMINMLGFIICTAILVGGITVLAGNRNVISIAAVAIATALVMYLVFAVLLQTRLPEILF